MQAWGLWQTCALIAALAGLPMCAVTLVADKWNAYDSQVRGEGIMAGIHLAEKAHGDGSIDEEIAIRLRTSHDAWASYARNHKSLDEFNLYHLIMFNDLPLALTLEGKHRWEEAEEIFRRNQHELEHLKIAGNDIKSQNGLYLAYLLAREDKGAAARSICMRWKKPTVRVGKDAVRAARQSVPQAPPYDTPEVETARWDLACGVPDEGMRMLWEQSKAYTNMLAPYNVLRDYFLSEGKIVEADKMDGLWKSKKPLDIRDFQ
jgi:hypothetical protein